MTLPKSEKKTRGPAGPAEAEPTAEPGLTSGEPGRRLVGIKEIAKYVRRSHSTVMLLHRGHKLPMVRVGGIWESNAAEIDRWLAEQVKSSAETSEASGPMRKRTARW